MSLVPEYASSSSEDERENDDQAPTKQPEALKSEKSNPVSVSSALSTTSSTPALRSLAKSKSHKQPKPKRKRQTLFLPPEIQRLLERGTNHSSSSSSSSEDEDGPATKSSKKKKKKKKQKKGKMPQKNNNEGDINDTTSSSSSLTFLPAPKHSYVAPEAPVPSASSHRIEHQQETQDSSLLYAQTQSHSQSQQIAAATTIDQSYAYGYPQNYPYGSFEQQVEEDFSTASRSSKAARNRERELERALQQGQFDQVADKIIEVQGPAADAWEAPPSDELASTDDVKVTASFWNSRAGTKVASAKPSRLQRQRHQLNQLAFDAKMREVELLNQRGQNIKTKRETQAKYGW